jgi:hypothetical protein
MVSRDVGQSQCGSECGAYTYLGDIHLLVMDLMNVSAGRTCLNLKPHICSLGADSHQFIDFGRQVET